MEEQGNRNPLKLAYGLMLLFTVVLYLRPMEIFEQMHGIRLPQLIGVAIVIGLLLKHHHLEWGRFRHNILKWISLYLVAVLMSVPFGLWPGGSVRYLQETLVKELVVVFVLISVVFTLNDLRRILLTVGLSCSFLAFLTLGFFAKEEFLVGGYRAALSGGVFSDPNDLAACFVFSLPFLYFGGLKISRRKLFFAIVIALLAVGVLITQSRGGMLGLIAVLFFGWLLDAEKRKRNFLLLVLSGVLIAVILPSAVERLATIADPEKDSVGSIQARITTLKSGVEFFLQNPVLGVGVACFEIAEGDTHGGVGKWNAAHNMWIEVAAETGLLGFVGFAGCLFAILKSLARLRRNASNHLWVKNMAEALLCSTVGFLVCGTFLSHSGSWNLFYLIGLTVALESIWAKNQRNLEEEGLRQV